MRLGKSRTDHQGEEGRCNMIATSLLALIQRLHLESSYRFAFHFQSPTIQLYYPRYMINSFNTCIHQYNALLPLHISLLAVSQCPAIQPLQFPWPRAVLEHLAQAHPKACSALLNASMTARISVLLSNAASVQHQTVQQKWVQAVRQMNVPRASPFQPLRLRAPETSDLVWPVQ